MEEPRIVHVMTPAFSIEVVSTSKGPSSGYLTCRKVQSKEPFVRPLAVDHKAAVAICTKTLRLVKEETRLTARKAPAKADALYT